MRRTEFSKTSSRRHLLITNVTGPFGKQINFIFLIFNLQIIKRNVYYRPVFETSNLNKSGRLRQAKEENLSNNIFASFEVNPHRECQKAVDAAAQFIFTRQEPEHFQTGQQKKESPMSIYYVSSGQVSSGINLNLLDMMYVLSAGTALNTSIQLGALTVRNRGLAVSTALNFGGFMHISSGGTGNTIAVNSGGLYISSGGTAVAATVNPRGSMYVSAGGRATAAIVNSGGSLTISAGGTATAIIENGGFVTANGTNVSFASNTFSGLALTNGSATVHSGTTAAAASINTGGRLYIYNPGSAVGTTVNSGGRIFISSGGKATGTLTIATGQPYLPIPEASSIRIMQGIFPTCWQRAIRWDSFPKDTRSR